MKEIRDLAKKYTPEQIEGCITTQMETGGNLCLSGNETEALVRDLAKAKFVRSLTEEGMSLADALRELARRMRQLQAADKETGEDGSD